jgi:hypothetical protein
MICPKCKAEYREGFTTCADCKIPLVSKLPPNQPPEPTEYIKYVHLYSPQDEVELALLKSILDAEGISYFVKNDHFGSLEVGPRIDIFNAKMIEVQDHQYERAQELLSDYFEKTKRESQEPPAKHSLLDKIRMAGEILLFGWMMPGRKNRNTRD